MRLRLDVTAVGGVMVATRRDGVEHSRWLVEEVDPIEVLSRQEAGELAPGRPWSLEALDDALARQGYQRTGDWTAGVGGPTCPVTGSGSGVG